MPFNVQQQHPGCPIGKPFGVIDQNAKLQGCHVTKAEAMTQIADLNKMQMKSADAPRDNLVRANFGERAAVADGRTMHGYPIVFNTPTIINSREGHFEERIAPGAVNQTLKVGRDEVRVLFNHGMDPSIGDKPLGKATVMEPDAHGLRVEVPMSNTSYNDDLIALMRDGALDGMSFRFSVQDENWEYPEDGLPQRTITQMRLYEFGPVTFPAYQATTVGIRSRDDFLSWQGLDDTKKEQVARIMGTELRTLDDEAAVGTSSDGAAQLENDSEQQGAHSGVPQFMADRAHALAALLKGKTENHGTP